MVSEGSVKEETRVCESDPDLWFLLLALLLAGQAFGPA